MTTPPIDPPVEPLVTVDAFKQYARIETTAEDDLIAELLVEVVGLIETYIGKSLTTEEITITDDATTFRFYEGPSPRPPALILPYMQIDPASIRITDPGGLAIDPSTYRVRLDKRLVQGAFVLCSGAYTITCTAGYGTLPDYTTRWLPRIRSTIKDYALFLYQQRTPGASSEGAAGTSVSYGDIDPDTGLPNRVRMALRKLRGIIA